MIQAVRSQRSVSDNGRYPEFCAQASRDPEVFAHFKRDPVYREILEHVSTELGQEYLYQMKWSRLLDNIENFKINDSIGDPIRGHYMGIGLISPTTLRYLKVASDLHELFGNLDGFEVAEIGAGYGGQFLISDLVWNLKGWTIFDLEPVLQLIERYLGCFPINSTYRLEKESSNFPCGHFDLAISNYAFSELPREMQIRFINRVLSKADRGYITMNNASADCLTAVDLQHLIPGSEILEEAPLTSQGNYILVWGRN